MRNFAPHTALDRSPEVQQAHAPSWQRASAALLRYLEHRLDLHVLLVFRRELPADPVSVSPPESSYEFREIGAAELAAAADDPELELRAERVTAAAARGDSFFGVFHRGRLIGYRWYSLSGTTPAWSGMAIRYSHARRAYGYRTFTHADHRGKHLHAFSTAHSDAALVRRGCTHTIGYIDASNTASLRAYARLAEVRRIGTLVALRVFGHYCVWRSPGAARHCVALEPSGP